MMIEDYRQGNGSGISTKCAEELVNEMGALEARNHDSLEMNSITSWETFKLTRAFPSSAKSMLIAFARNLIKNFSLADLRTAFDLLDRDQDGMINNQELQFMLRNLGIELSDELIDGLMKEASKTGEFDYELFQGENL